MPDEPQRKEIQLRVKPHQKAWLEMTARANAMEFREFVTIFFNNLIVGADHPEYIRLEDASEEDTARFNHEFNAYVDDDFQKEFDEMIKDIPPEP